MNAVPANASIVERPVWRRQQLATRSLGLLLGATIVSLTVAEQQGAFDATQITASYERVMRHGEVWTLVTSALIAASPVWISLASFVAITVVALLLCPPRVFWTAAVAGQIGSAIVIYAFIALARSFDGQLYASSLTTADYGVSTMQAGLVGATALVLWQRSRGSLPRRALVVAGICVVAVIAWRLHPDRSVLTYEHVIAFAFGIVAAIALEPVERAVTV